MRLDLDPGNNQEYIKIIENSNEIWKEMVAITKALECINIPRRWPWMAGPQLKNVHNCILNITSKYNEWYKSALQLAQSPTMIIGGTSELERAVGFLHYQNMLINRIGQLEGKFEENERFYFELASISRGANILHPVNEKLIGM